MVEQVSEIPPCKHHWKIESPKGELSEGTCGTCGDKRMFRNYGRYFFGDRSYAEHNAEGVGPFSDSSSNIMDPRLSGPIPGGRI